MEFSTFICKILAPLGAAKPKKMFGTENITLNGVNLGVICWRKWYLKKTEAGDRYLAEHNLHLDTGIKENSYIITDFSNAEQIRALVQATVGELQAQKKNK